MDTLNTENIPSWAITDQCPAGEHGEACTLDSLGEFRDQSGLVGRVSVLKCRKCGVGVSRPLIPDVAFLYADRTSPDFQPTTASLSRFIKQIAFRGQAIKMIAQTAIAPRRVIDFACGSGLFTACFAQALPEGSEMIGTDFHAEPPHDLGVVPYYSINNLSMLTGTADLVLAMHVIEHDDDPKKLLNMVASLARPGGRLVVEVPNIDCVWTDVFGRNWDSWYLPYHRTHFSRRSLRGLVETCGLKILGEYDVSIPTMGRTIASLLGARNNTFFVLVSAALQPVQWLLEKLTRRPSALRILVEMPV